MHILLPFISYQGQTPIARFASYGEAVELGHNYAPPTAKHIQFQKCVCVCACAHHFHVV